MPDFFYYRGYVLKNVTGGLYYKQTDCLSDLSSDKQSVLYLVGVVRLELTASASRTQRATNCAIPRRR